MECQSDLIPTTGGRIIVSGLQAQPRKVLHRSGLLRRCKVVLATDVTAALAKAGRLLGRSPR